MNYRLFLRNRISMIGLWTAVVLQAKAAELEPIMMDKGEPIVTEDFSGSLDPEQWVVTEGQWTVDGGVLKGVELESDQHPAVIRRLVPFQDVVIQLDFRFDGCSQIIFSTNDKALHNSRVVIDPDGLTLLKDLDRWDPSDAGMVLGQCSYLFEKGKWYTLMVEYCGDEMLARIDDSVFVLGAHSYINQERISIRFPVYGETATFDNLRVWQGVPRDDWPEKRKQLREVSDSRRHENAIAAWKIAVSTLRHDLLGSDEGFQQAVEKTKAIALELKTKYPIASAKTKAGIALKKRLLVEDPVIKRLYDELSRSQKAEYDYLLKKNPRLVTLDEEMKAARTLKESSAANAR